MKNDSRNPFYASAKVERGTARVKVFKALDKEECGVWVRSYGEREVFIGVGDRFELAFASIVLDTQEAKKFANMILGVADALERKGECRALDRVS